MNAAKVTKPEQKGDRGLPYENGRDMGPGSDGAAVMVFPTAACRVQPLLSSIGKCFLNLFFQVMLDQFMNCALFLTFLGA